MNNYLASTIKLHKYLLKQHWNGNAIIGPDPIGKINWRITRFIKGYTRWLSWPDRYIYLQGQSYWIRANLQLGELTGESDYLDLASQGADYVVQAQLPNGAWAHPPLGERRGFVSTVESVWAGLGLMAAYKKLAKPIYLDAVIKGYEALANVIGFSHFKDGLAVNYYAHSKDLVPNVSTMFLWLIAEIYTATSDEKYLEYAGPMLRFLEYSQLPSGELQYNYQVRPHFQCYQYNSFQFLDLANYYTLTKNEQVRPIITKMAHFLAAGVTERGSCRYDCFRENPETNYWTAALAAALLEAHRLEVGQYQDLSERAYQHLLNRQNHDGSFGFSNKNYKFLADKRSYPRQQAMILNFLLTRAADRQQTGLR